MLGTALLAGCADPAAPGPADVVATGAFRLTALPPDTALAQRAVAVTIALDPAAAARGHAELEIVVDPDTPEATRRVLIAGGQARFGPLVDGAPLSFAANVPAVAGAHTVVVRHTDAAGRVDEARFTRTFRVPTVAYTARPLVGPGGEPADAEGLDERGDVAGWTTAPDGAARPLVWRGGVPSVLPLPAGLAGATARRINARGDVVGLGAPGTDLVVWPAGGAPVRPTVPRLAPDGVVVTAFPPSVPIDLTEGGRVLLGFATYDLASAAWVALPTAEPLLGGAIAEGSFVSLGEQGQAVGVLRRGLYTFVETATPGVARYEPAGAPRALRTGTHGRWGLGPRAVDADGRVLRLEDSGVLTLSLPPGAGARGGAGEAVHLDEAFGFGDPLPAVVLSRRGGVLAGVGPADSALYVWRVADRTPRRVVVAGDAWRVTRVRAVTAGGLVLATGRERATGRVTALLLTPTGAPAGTP